MRKPLFRYNSRGWYYRSSPIEINALRGLPGFNMAQCEVGPFRSLPAAYDAVRWRLAA